MPNPDYKGEWVPPKIKNPNYKGKWTPRQIPNPKYFNATEKPLQGLLPVVCAFVSIHERM